MSRQRGLGPFAENALRGAGHELLRSFADQANDAGAGFVVEAARGEYLRDLFAELAIALERFLDVLADRGGQARLHCGAVGACGVRQGLIESAIDRGADGALEIFVGAALEGGVGGEGGGIVVCSRDPWPVCCVGLIAEVATRADGARLGVSAVADRLQG